MEGGEKRRMLCWQDRARISWNNPETQDKHVNGVSAAQPLCYLSGEAGGGEQAGCQVWRASNAGCTCWLNISNHTHESCSEIKLIRDQF